ncbi:TIGR03621 family F420-dependent LLM class oxidoreductase [Actinomadura rudentiformis]|uniref:TIGR03621 family F420-dependent LLM class oxidoreductase n=1 Tax=Actinomadura rudentiformis TaxID=359158 RepID=A0A6H9YV85_9ACTN|nr:TIGR03621 family F420-dependent LLM class oxidoreductase [Actinomadura rudentiformis]KAB2345493.1 TIGR03621 family F420-dependent LLM class oxidoreductase [Actinomadura rudentiformis]
MRDFRFGFNIRDVRSRADFVERCRRAEGFGYDVALAADHLGAPAPFPTMVAAADATDRMRVGSLVLNVAFWNSHLLAREIATADRLTGGRVEIGLGAGHMKWEFDKAGIPWQPFDTRVERLAETLDELGCLFARSGYEQQRAVTEAFGLADLAPEQRTGLGGLGPPLLIGGTGDTVLKLAAQYADIIGVAGTYQAKGEPPGTFLLGTAEQADERVRFAREHAGERADAIEWNLLVQFVVVTADRRAVAEEMGVQKLPYLTADEILETPYLLIGTEEQMAEQLRERRERYGFSYVTVHGSFMDTFGPVIERLR